MRKPVTGTATAPAAATARSLPATEGTILSLRAVAVHSDHDPLRVALLADASGTAPLSTTATVS
jgi:hypothetical protein